ncbi:uncharacterized protein SETTUDRAFT_93357 [Exserohilum turcica Et28A]|uniref:Zygote-specific protein n=1 Tax=Exserohilum turcicum (strain 28A) TaxID=671987 RepID=R0IGN8_EXST2|nr:uncharacterized protein SETTUDRAFT_93357 [Exserohilum turcica Et28A]EOA84151.1 hypothetical protein SETTUDRAFT_93357 [Exserohilum turcica Et28A]
MNLPSLNNTAVAILILSSQTSAGPLGYAVCQAGCASVVMACYSAAGYVWGNTLSADAPDAVIGCNLAFGKCQAACAEVTLGTAM